MINIAPLPFTPIPIDGNRWQTPEASAAYYGDVATLEKLFDEGASPNAVHADTISPLEAAILGGQPECVKIVLANPAFAPTTTEPLLNAFALNGTDNAVSACCELAAPAVLGCEFVSTDNASLPDDIKLPHIIYAGNWMLLLRYAKYHGIDAKELRKVAEGMCWKALEKNSRYGIPILARLLTACPDLLKHRIVQQCFVALALSNPSGIPQELIPFVQLLPKKIILTEGSAFRWGGAGNLLSRWRSHLGTLVSPHLDLGRRLPDDAPSEEAVEHLLRVCTLCGKIPEKHSSPLLIDIIAYASEDTLLSHLQPGGKLAHIDNEHFESAARAMLVSPERRNLIAEILKEGSSC